MAQIIENETSVDAAALALAERLATALPHDALVACRPVLIDGRGRRRTPAIVLLSPDVGAVAIEPADTEWEAALATAAGCAQALREHLERKQQPLPVFHAVITPTEGRSAHVIPENALNDRSALTQALVRLRANANAPGAEAVRQAANALGTTPPEAPLPAIETEVSEAPPWEEARARYDHYRTLLRQVAGEIREVILSDGAREPLRRRLDRVRDDLDRDVFTVGVFGVIAAGKSTFINALLGERILRPGTGETTKTIVRITAPVHACGDTSCGWQGPAENACPRCGGALDVRHPHRSATLTYKSPEELREELLSCLASIQFATLDSVEADTLDVTAESTRELLRALVDQAPARRQPELKSAYHFVRGLLDGWNAGIPHLGRSRAASFEDLVDDIHREEVALFVRECTLYYDCELTRKRFVLIDSPGLGSNVARHTDLALRVADRVDAALLVTRVGYALKSPDLAFIWNLVDRRRPGRKPDLLFVLNQIGLIDPLHYDPPRSHDEFDLCVNDERDRLLETLEDEELCEVLSNPLPYAIDAACAFYARAAACGALTPDEEAAYRRVALTDRRSDVPDPRLNLQASRLPALEKDLVTFVTRNRFVLFLENRLTALERLTDEFRLANREELEDLDRDLDELNSRLRTHNESYRRTRALLDEYVMYALDARVREQYEQRLSADTRELVDMAADLCAREYRREAALPRIGVNATPNQIFQRVRESVSRELVYAIRTVRRSYHERYRAVRDEAINVRIPEIVREYGEHINWKITSADIDYAELETIQGLGGLKLTLWQRLRAGLGGGDAARAEMFRRNFREELGPILRRDLTGWIRRDLASMQDQILRKFDDLMAAINQRILHQVQMIRTRQSERDTRRRALLHYEKQCDRALDRLNALRGHIESLRPRRPHLLPC